MRLQILQIFLISIISGCLCLLLGNIVLDGLKTGAIRHADPQKVCSRKNNPAGYWGLIGMISGFIVIVLVKWFFAVVEAVRTIKP